MFYWTSKEQFKSKMDLPLEKVGKTTSAFLTKSHAFEVCVPAHVALGAFFAFSQPVNCIFWPMKVLNWLVAESKLHRHWETCCTAGWPYCAFAILCHKPTVTTKQKSCKNLSTGYYFVFKYFLRYEEGWAVRF